MLSYIIKNKNIFFKILIIFTFIFGLFSVNANAVEVKFEYTQEYLDWLKLSDEEKAKVPPPQMTSTSIKNKKRETSWADVLNMVGSMENNSLVNKSRFNLADYIDLEVKNQGITMECWAFSTLSSMESNLLYKKGIKENFSERHMDYATSSSFYDVDKESLDYVRDVSFGGLSTISLAYLTNGQGAVLEEEMPFEDSKEEISIEEINIKPSYYVSEYVQLPSIYKTYNTDGSINYFDAYANEYTMEEVNSIRREIKNYIVNNGALTSVTASNYNDGYNNPEQIAYSTAFCCKDSTLLRDHAITIVGWDDNYSKENFNPNSKPSNDGAYIVLQSYGDFTFDNGYMYISYEDSLIESLLYGVSDSKEYDYDNLYQHDYYGANGTLYLPDYEVGCFASVFQRDKTKDEILNKISFNLAEPANVEVWINPNNSELSSNTLKKVSDVSEILNPGYHTIEITPTELTGDSFVVAIKQKSESGDFYFNIEFKGDKIMSAKADSEPGRNKISVDGVTWSNLEDLSDDDLINTADLCIKAFTINKENFDGPIDDPIDDQPDFGSPDNPIDKESEINSEIYKISLNYIKNIQAPTTTKEFLENIQIKSNKIEIYDGKEKIDLSTEGNLKSGMKLILDDKEYTLILRGDINCDGKISIIDLSKLLSHYAEIKGCEMTELEKEAGDMNLDDKISIIDLSQLLVIYSKL